MTQTISDPAHWENRRQQWIARVEALIAQIEDWAGAEGWATARAEKTVYESSLGNYKVPLLRVRLPAGEIHVAPVALQIVGANGRVDIEAFPALNRVKLIGRDDQWEIYADSNLPLRRPWDQQTFVQLAQDLVA
jgi:hypothetical protein